MARVAIVVNGDQPPNLYPAFVLGSAAAALGDDVIIFFTPFGTPAMKPGVLEGMEGKGLPPMKDLVEGIQNAGGRLVLCELALNHYRALTSPENWLKVPMHARQKCLLRKRADK